MRSLELLIEKEIGTAKLGQMYDINRSFNDMQLNQLSPYIGKTEDMKVILQNDHLLMDNQPLEFNGFHTKQLLNTARNLELKNLDPFIPYSELANTHPPIMSFPSEVFWLAIPDGLTKFKDNITWVLQRDNIGFDKSKADKISDYYTNLIKSNAQKYSFWGLITEKYESETLSKLLIESTIELALQSKMKFLAGLTPIINSNTPNSISISHKMNLAYGNIIDDRIDRGDSAPNYFYTIALNSSMISNDNYTDGLKKIVDDTRQAMQYDLFDGIHVSIRGLPRISEYSGRVNTLSKFIIELNNVANDELLPIWWSRFGLIGLTTLDTGASFSSYTLNMNLNDIYSRGFGGKQKEKQLHGKVLNPSIRKLLDANQISKLKDNLPKIDGVSSKPTDSENEKAVPYRINFGKPYNIAAMRWINEKWLKDIKNGEINPGKEYIKTFDSPAFYNNWGMEGF